MQRLLLLMVGVLILACGGFVLLCLFVLTAGYAFYALTLLSGVALGAGVLAGAILLIAIRAFNRILVPSAKRLIFGFE